MRHPRSSPRRTLVAGVVVSCLLALVGPIGPAGADGSHPASDATVKTAATAEAKIKPKLVRQLDNHDTVDFWVRFTEKTDLTAARRTPGWNKRGAAVANGLRTTAATSQADVRSLLRKAGVRFQAFWVTNAIKVTGGTEELAAELASQPEVDSLWPSFKVEVPEPTEAEAVPTVDDVEWGVANIHAQDVWAQYGARGEGIVVGSIDTGVQFDHPALVGQYRGTRRDGTFDHNYNWFDAAGGCAGEPCDTNGHGTHTMGTMAGSDGIGVAPGVTWIAANGCCPTDAALVASGQWMVAPTDLNGENPDPSKRPDIVNNSWGTQQPSNAPFLDDISAAWKASGIFGIWANGNNGPQCQTSGSPGSLVHNYSVGAYDANGTVGSFSSRGAGQDGETKPNISAPGVSVRSAWPGDGYEVLDGTSMATPHAAGAIALLWSAAPVLAGDIDTTMQLLDTTAVDKADDQCGGTADDNNVYGEGQLDALALMDQAPIGATGRISGVVTASPSGEPIAEALVTINGSVDREVETGADGSYLSPSLPVGDYSITVKAYGWVTEQFTATVEDGTTLTTDVVLGEAEMATVSGVVRDASGHGWPLYAKLTIADYPLGAVFTDPVTGRYEVLLPEGSSRSVTVAPEYAGYTSTTDTLDVGTEDVSHDIGLIIDKSACNAPGYRWNGTAQGFDGWTRARPRDGWTRQNQGHGAARGWRYDNPGQRAAPVGASGRFAIADSRRVRGSWVRTSLTSPALNLRRIDRPRLTFDSAYFAAGSKTRARVRVSIDNGRTWRTVWKRTDRTTTGQVALSLRRAANHRKVRVRFNYKARNGRWWAVDNMFVGDHSCVPAAGGLVVGTTRDRSTDAPIFATVEAPSGQSARSLLTPKDANLADGFYALFVPMSGKTSLTVRAPGYASTTGSVSVRSDDTTLRDWTLVAEGD